jgi:hypothetical protein
MLTSVDGKSFVRQPNWAWIAGSVYYVPPEAVGMVREVVEERAAEEMTDEELCGWLRSMLPPSGFAPAENWWAPWLGADRIEALTAENERWRGMLEMVLRESVDIECGDRILYAGTVNDIRAALEKQTVRGALDEIIHASMPLDFERKETL